MHRIALCATENDLRNPYAKRSHTDERSLLAQHRRPSERVQPAAMDMPGLTLDVEQLTITAHNTLNTAFPTATDVGFFYPFTALIPEVIEAVLGSDVRFCCTLHCHSVTSCVKRRPATWHRAVKSSVVPGYENPPAQIPFQP
ncbi:hypothetical protein D3C85_1505200 [compost metagenome]